MHDGYHEVDGKDDQCHYVLHMREWLIRPPSSANATLFRLFLEGLTRQL